MDSTEIAYILDEVGASPKITDKKEILRANDTPELRRILAMAYDPMITYGVLKIAYIKSGRGNFDESTYDLLESLKDRELTGHAAMDAIEAMLKKLSLESGRLFVNILNKDLRAGINIKLIQEVFPGLINRMPYMRCSTEKQVNTDLWDWTRGIYLQRKADGLFMNVVYGDSLTFRTRQGQLLDSSKVRQLTADAMAVLKEGYVYHGELLVYKNERLTSRSEGNGIINRLLKGGSLVLGETPRLYLWDMVNHNEFFKGYSSEPYNDRWARLDSLDFLKGRNHSLYCLPTDIFYSPRSADEALEALILEGAEGAIVKHPDLIWKDHTSPMQVKKKPVYECELRMEALIQGNGRLEDLFGSILCTSECGELKVSVSGFTDEKRKDIKDNWEKKYRYQIITVKFKEVITSKTRSETSLFEPRYGGDRFDLDAADTLHEILARFK
jgi:DNA ligase-1